MARQLSMEERERIAQMDFAGHTPAEFARARGSDARGPARYERQTSVIASRCTEKERRRRPIAFRGCAAYGDRAASFCQSSA